MGVNGVDARLKRDETARLGAGVCPGVPVNIKFTSYPSNAAKSDRPVLNARNLQYSSKGASALIFFSPFSS